MRGAIPIGAALLCALAACAGDSGADGQAPAAPPMHPAWRRTRIAVADAEAPRLTILDVELGEPAGEIALPEPARDLVVASSGEHLLAAHDGSASVIYAGISLLDHSEGASDSDEPHIHVYKFPPRLVAYPLTGPGRPRLLAHDDRFALLFPGEGASPAEALTFPEAALLDEAPPPPARSPLDAPYAGVAFPLGGQVLLAGPDGVSALAVDGSRRALTAACGDAPPAARAAGRAAFACDAGLIVVEATGADLVARELPYPPGAPRPTALTGHVERPILLAHDDRPTAARHDLASGGAPVELALPAAPCELALEPGDGETAVLLAPDGWLSLIDAATGDILARREVVAPFSCGAAVRPRLALAPARAYVSDPARRAVHELWLDGALTPLATFPVEGAPSVLAVAGVDEQTRNLGDLSD